MSKPYCYEYPRPSVTVDVVAFCLREASLRVLLIRRKADPFAGRWAIPGGFLEMDEPVEEGARRELREETGIDARWPLDPIGFFGAVDRDPRGRTISLAFATVFRPPAPEPVGADDASEAAWVEVDRAGPLAFDHDSILASARTWLELSVQAGPAGLVLLPEPFEVGDVRSLMAALGRSETDADDWRDRLLRSGAIVAADGRPNAYRAADPALRVVPSTSP